MFLVSNRRNKKHFITRTSSSSLFSLLRTSSSLSFSLLRTSSSSSFSLLRSSSSSLFSLLRTSSSSLFSLFLSKQINKQLSKMLCHIYDDPFRRNPCRHGIYRHVNSLHLSTFQYFRIHSEFGPTLNSKRTISTYVGFWLVRPLNR